MRKYKSILALVIATTLLSQLQGCYGNFAMTRKLYQFNGTIKDKYLRSLATFVMVACQVYTVVGVLDFAVFNTVQFWTGTNPVALKPGEKETQMVEWKGKTYQLIATQNCLEIKPMNGNLQGPSVYLKYAVEKKTWSAETTTSKQKLIEILDTSGQVANLIYPDGHKETVTLAVD